MKYVTLPNTDLRVSQLGLGTASLGSISTLEQAFEILDTFVAAGGNFLDSAHVYANWLPGEKSRSEKTLGKWLRARGNAGQIVIATKGGHEDLGVPGVPRVTPELVAQDLQDSLEYLDVPCIDLYLLHRDDPTREVGPILELLHAQVEAGRIRYFGCSNWEPARISAAHAYAAQHGLHSFTTSQILWSLAHPNPGAVTPEHAIMTDESWQFYQQAGMGVMAFTSQARGFFVKAAAAGGVEKLHPDLRQAFDNEITRARFSRVQAVARRLGAPITAVVLAYIYSQPIVAVPFVGTNTIAQLHDSLSDPDLHLDPATLRYLRDGVEME